MMNAEALRPHSVGLHERKRAELSGITEVESFQDTAIVLHSTMGDIAIEGEELKIDSFSVESGQIQISGTLRALLYYDAPRNRRSRFFARREK